MSAPPLPARLTGLRTLAARCLQPPVGDGRFWIIQVLVILAGTVYWFTLAGSPSAVSWLPPHAALALFLVPVGYAALNFGLSGSLATVGWVVLLGAVSLARNHGPADVSAVGIQVASMIFVAAFVGQRVEHEVRARREAEAAGAAMRRSEARLRGLLDTSPAPTLLVGEDGGVRAGNPAAAALFGRARDELRRHRLSDLIGAHGARAVMAGVEAVQDVGLPGGRDRYLRPVISRIPGSGNGVQVVFLDVSEERARLGMKDAYAAYVVKAQEDERARIAQELHDEPLQQVMQLCRQLDPSASPSDIESTRRLAEQIAAELRRMARGLRPPALEDLGLVAGLRMLVRDTASRSSTGIELVVEGSPRRLDEAIELGLFRIAQEGLRNVERHARASTARLALTFMAERVELTLTDDGAGLRTPIDGPVPADDVAFARGLGLIGMQERASVMGGTFTVRSRPGSGASLRVTIPG